MPPAPAWLTCAEVQQCPPSPGEASPCKAGAATLSHECTPVLMAHGKGQSTAQGLQQEAEPIGMLWPWRVWEGKQEWGWVVAI